MTGDGWDLDEDRVVPVEAVVDRWLVHPHWMAQQVPDGTTSDIVAAHRSLAAAGAVSPQRVFDEFVDLVSTLGIQRLDAVGARDIAVEIDRCFEAMSVRNASPEQAISRRRSAAARVAVARSGQLTRG